MTSDEALRPFEPVPSCHDEESCRRHGHCMYLGCKACVVEIAKGLNTQSRKERHKNEALRQRCACKSLDHYDCWSIRYYGHSCYAGEEMKVQSDGGPCECACHADDEDCGDE